MPRPADHQGYPSDSLTHPCSILQQDSIQRPYFLNCSILAASPCKHRHTRETPVHMCRSPPGVRGGGRNDRNPRAIKVSSISEGAWALTRTKPRCEGACLDGVVDLGMSSANGRGLETQHGHASSDTPTCGGYHLQGAAHRAIEIVKYSRCVCVCGRVKGVCSQKARCAP